MPRCIIQRVEKKRPAKKCKKEIQWHPKKRLGKKGKKRKNEWN